MAAYLNAHRTTLGLVLLLLTTALGMALLFDWRLGGPPSGAVLVTPPSPGATPAAATHGPEAPAAALATAPAIAHLLKVYITGAVQHPGVYSVDSAARIADLLTAAGGPVPGADLAQVNLAAHLQDAEQIVVPLLGTPGQPAPAPPVSAATGAPAAGKAPTGPIDINRASEATLETLPGIGPVLAGRIVEYRTAHGPFARVEAIQDVPGVGAKLFEKLKSYITVGP